MRAEILEAGIELALHLVEDHPGNAYATGISQLFEPGRDVHAVPIEVVAVDDDVAHIHADAQGNRAAGRHIEVPLGHPALDADCAFDSVDGTAELDQRAVAHQLYDTAAVFDDQGVDQGGAQFLERAQRSHLVRAHEAAVAHHIGGYQGGKTPLDTWFWHCPPLPGDSSPQSTVAKVGCPYSIARRLPVT
jgi:hypothetical protein